MPALDSSQKLVAVKAYARGNAIPLDASSAYDNIEDATEYASTSPVAYEGQIITAVVDNVPKAYTLKRETSGYSLAPIGLNDEELEQLANLEWGTIGE